jgi:TolB-like protein/Flp pilus assembly protein TadD
MASALKPHLHLEVGHILFLDIVGYSKLLADEQKELVQELNQIVRETKQFQAAEAERKLTRLPTGDGMVLVFTNNPEAPVECALEISRALQSHSKLKLRMGIHSGPVNPVVDVNDQANLAGAGINMAERVMSCGDAGHILLSKNFAEHLEHYAHWRSHLHNVGEVKTKHGVKIPLVNLYTDQLGNSALPVTLRRARAAFRLKSAAIAALLLLATLGVGLWMLRSSQEKFKSAVGAILSKSIAVLPFENLSEEKANAYFAEGIKDEILTKLAAVHDLKVISRTSTAKYQSKPDNLKNVAQELGVSTVLEGTVQKAGDKVRVNVQLIDARADAHLWAKSYDRDLKDILAVESEVSQEIADVLQAKLSPSESHALASAGTGDAEAYDLFLRGEYEFHQSESRENGDANDRAEEFYRQALARDPNFADASAGLARSRLRRHWFFSPLTPSELKDVTSIIDRALAVAPNSPQAHLALGLFFYRGNRQYGIALTEFNHTLELQPNNALARLYSGWIHRRRGEWERSLADLQRAQELDPRNAGILVEIGANYQILRLWKDAERTELRALAMDPHNSGAADILLKTRLNATGDIDSARRVFDGFPEDIKSSLSGLDPGGYQGGGNVMDSIGVPVYLDLMQRRFSNAFQALEKEVAEDDRGHLLQLVGRVVLRLLEGQTEAAKSAGEQALPLLEGSLRERPDDTSAITELSWIYLVLGRNADALRLSRQAANLMPIEKDAVLGPSFQATLAQIEARAGEREEAIKRLRHLLSIPAGETISIARLKIDPVWDPLRKDPGFQKLLSEPEPETVYK